MNDKQLVFLRVSVHGVGGRGYQPEAEVRLEREGRSTRFTKAPGAAYAEEHVEPGSYGLVVVAGELTSPRQHVVVGPEGKTTSAYLGRPDWPFYRLGEHAVPFEPHPDLLAVAFPSGKPDPGTARRQAGEIADRVNVRQVPLPEADEKQHPGGRVGGEGAGEADAGGAAIWLFQFADAPSPGDRRDAAAVIRDIVGDRARIGVPVDLQPGQAKVIDNRFATRFRDGVDAETIKQLVEEAGGRVLRRFRQTRNAYLIELPDGDVLASLATVEDWARRDLLVYGEPDVMAQITDDVFPDTAPTDPTFTNQANLTLQQVDVAWRIMRAAGPNITIGDPAVRVATLDRGVDIDHPDIGGNLTDGTPQLERAFDFDGMRQMTAAGYAPDTSHGMGVYGIIAALTDNGVDMSGIAPNTHQLGLERPDLTDANYPDILLWAAGFDTDNGTSGWPAEPISPGAAIISCSHGSDGLALSGIMDDTLQELADNGRGGLGTVVIYSAGNSDTLITGFRTWAAHPDTLAIANSMQPNAAGVETRDPTSNFGPEIDVCAQGTNAPSLDDVGGEQTFGGTSAAAPTVAGVVALLLSRDPTLTRVEVRDILRATAVQVDAANTDPIGQWAGGFSQWYGFGRINAADAVCGRGPGVTLQTPSVTFNSIPEGETTVRSVTFGVDGCQAARFDVVTGPGAPFTLPLGASAQLPIGAQGVRQARIWIGYTGTTDGDTASGSITVRHVETGDDFTVPITADTVRRPTVVVGLVLDKSGSMDFSSGLSTLPRRLDVLKFSVPPLIEVIQDQNALGIVSFATDAQQVMPVTVAGPPVFGGGRAAARTAVTNHATDPSGLTAIGDGVEEAHDLLAPETAYDLRATIVFTDGHETAEQYISDVSSLIDERVYAIGLGTADEIQPTALTSLTNSTGGYLLLTGQLGNDDTFLLAKYYLQILAGVTNEDIVVDPQGAIVPGQRHRIAFAMTEADINCDVILLSPGAPAISLSLETPAGDLITASDVGIIPALDLVSGDTARYYRFTLPVPLRTPAAGGTWHAVLEVDKTDFKRQFGRLKEVYGAELVRFVSAHGLPYSVNVHSYSNLRLRASLAQDGLEPGARLTLRGVLTEYGLPVEDRAQVHADVTRPDGTSVTVTLPERSPGVFETALTTTLSGVYRCTVKAAGVTMRRQPFTREQIVTGQVWRGGNQPPPRTDGNSGDSFCRWVKCLLNSGLDTPELVKRLQASGIDLEAVARCCARAKR